MCMFTLLDRSLKFVPMRLLFLPVTVLRPYEPRRASFTRKRESEREGEEKRAYACM